MVLLAHSGKKWTIPPKRMSQSLQDQLICNSAFEFQSRGWSTGIVFTVICNLMPYVFTAQSKISS